MSTREDRFTLDRKGPGELRGGEISLWGLTLLEGRVSLAGLGLVFGRGEGFSCYQVELRDYG